jgi:hypothetical protein
MAALLIALSLHVQSVRYEPEDCDAIYQSIVQQHHNDVGWLTSHVLLNKTESGRFIAPGIPDMLARLPLRERIRFWWEFHSFTLGKDGEPLAYSRVSEPRLRVISPNELPGFLARGLEVLNFSKPGFSFDHKRAVVFVGVEVPNVSPIAPFFHGALLYFAKVGGQWVRDEHPPALNLSLVT